MKLVKQVKLFLQEGTSDKVYEIDLCESGDGFVVNFRYGRRGTVLKEGTKTIFPLPLQVAEKVFNSLEQEKRKKGYVAAGEASLDLSVEIKPKGGSDKRKKAIVRILKAATLGEEPENWPLSRAIWRAGDLKLSEAIPHIIELADPKDKFIMHSVVYVIAKCGSDKQVPFLKEIQQTLLPESLQLLIKEVILELSDQKEKDILLQNIIESLPAPFKKCIAEKNYKELDIQLHEFLFNLKTASNEYLISLYQISRQDPITNYFFRKTIEAIPFTFNYFKYIRHIFKTAEMLEDFAMYGIIAKSIEKQAFNYHVNWWTKEEHKKQRAFSDKTKHYLSKRVVRFLNKYGEAGEPTYTRLASEILLTFDDQKDLTEPTFTVQYAYDYNSQTRRYTRVEKRTNYDSYSQFNAFYNILYKNSLRYVAAKISWKCADSYTPGSPDPTIREEAFPKLWDLAPKEIIKLLAFSKCARVHEFAMKVFKANPDFENQVETQDVIHFIQTSFALTQALGLELARKKFDRQAPDKELLTAMIDCGLEEARKQAAEWIQELKNKLFQDTEFVVGLLKMEKMEAHLWLRAFLSTTSFKKEQAQAITAKIISFLVTLKIETEEEEKYASLIGDTLITGFSDHLKYISMDIIRDLFRHASFVIHAFAGKILIKHDIDPENLPEDFLALLLKSDNPQTRSIGIELFGKFPENILLEKKEILVSFCLSPMADVRNAVKPLISKLAKRYPAFGEDLVNLFVPAFLMKEAYEGIHDDLLDLLSTELNGSLSVISSERTYALLYSKFRVAQMLGAVLLKKNIKEEDILVPDLVKLISNPQEDIRIVAQNIFKKQPEKIKASKEECLRITDSIWDDTRAFAFDYFRNSFTAADWNAELLVSLCDSTKEDVQDFGKEMITKCFKDDDGTAYLLKLSQHPNTKLQLFTTAYLEKYAGGKPEIIEKLKPYFITLLSQVNKGKVAKIRAMSFLKAEALKNEHVAEIASDIFTRISASVAISEKAGCIEALRDIQKKYPVMRSFLVIKEYSDYIKE